MQCQKKRHAQRGGRRSPDVHALIHAEHIREGATVYDKPQVIGPPAMGTHIGTSASMYAKDPVFTEGRSGATDATRLRDYRQQPPPPNMRTCVRVTHEASASSSKPLTHDAASTHYIRALRRTRVEPLLAELRNRTGRNAQSMPIRCNSRLGKSSYAPHGHTNTHKQLRVDKQATWWAYRGRGIVSLSLTKFAKVSVFFTNFVTKLYNYSLKCLHPRLLWISQ